VGPAAELQAACESRFDEADMVFMAAAVADFRPSGEQAGKLKKDHHAEGLTLALEPTDDILAGLAARRRPGQVLVGFAAEHGEDAVAHGRGKLERKGLDAVVVNDISRAGIGFDAPTTRSPWCSRTASAMFPRQPRPTSRAPSWTSCCATQSHRLQGS
jgi:phosphopantothenoylcysteine decarboxylase/phosphopantothenate--cysteine ligase